MARSGRPPVISRERLSAVAIELFESRGFAETTIADIASAAGIAPRTFFLYFSSKAEAFWFNSEQLFSEMEERLVRTGIVLQPIDTVIDLAISGELWQSHDRAQTRTRYGIVDATVELQAASLGYHRRWVETVEKFLRANGIGEDDDWLPAVIAATMLAVGNTVTREWAFSGHDESLVPRLERYLRGAVGGLLSNSTALPS